MNVFYLSRSPDSAAIYHCDKHVVKMIVEYCQILSTCHRVLDNSDDPILYKKTHVHHPSVKWAMSSIENYSWLHSLLFHLSYEYTHRYLKTHKCKWTGLIDHLKIPPKSIPKIGFTEPPPAMPDESKIYTNGELNSLLSYRNYYIKDKVRMLKWKNRNIPHWIGEYNEL